MMSFDLLVGSTGFVGGNLAAKHDFAAACHSSDIAAHYGTKPDLCVYAGVPAAMFLANADPEADLAVMRAARENIRKIAPPSPSGPTAAASMRTTPPLQKICLPMEKIACSWNNGCGRISPMRSSSACPRCTALGSKRTSSLICTPSPLPC